MKKIAVFQNIFEYAVLSVNFCNLVKESKRKVVFTTHSFSYFQAKLIK